MKNLVISLLLQCTIFLMAEDIFSQQDAQYTQYMYNTNIINPAYAGTNDRPNISIMNRSQWTGLEGAPVTRTLNVDTPIGKNGLGIGLSLLNDRIGPISEQLFTIDASYQLQVLKTHTLAFGLKSGLTIIDVDFNILRIFDNIDFSFAENIENNVSPNIGAGLYYFSEDRYLGVSVPNLIKSWQSDNQNDIFIEQQRSLYIIGGYVFDVGSDWKFKPTALTKFSSGAPLAVDVSGNFFYKKRLTIGASYRYGAAVSALAGFQISGSWFIGYSYDTDTTSLAGFNAGSHELMMRFGLNWFQKKNCTCSPYF